MDALASPGTRPPWPTYGQADNDSELMQDMGQQLLLTGKFETSENDPPLLSSSDVMWNEGSDVERSWERRV